MVTAKRTLDKLIPLNESPKIVKHSSDVLSVDGSGGISVQVIKVPPIMRIHADFLFKEFNFISEFREQMLGCAIQFVEKVGIISFDKSKGGEQNKSGGGQKIHTMDSCDRLSGSLWPRQSRITEKS